MPDELNTRCTRMNSFEHLILSMVPLLHFRIERYWRSVALSQVIGRLFLRAKNRALLFRENIFYSALAKHHRYRELSK